MLKFGFLLAIAALLVGCASGFSKFYQGLPNGASVPGYVNTGESVRIFGTDDFDRGRAELFKQGYVGFGGSSFTAGTSSVDEDELLKQAQKLGAHAVLTRRAYSSTSTGVMPITTPTTSTSYTTANATAYGSRGTVNAFGNATTTTYGSTTNYVPFSVERSSFMAEYFVKVRSRLGVAVRPLNDEERQASRSNNGLRVYAVNQESPAYQADIFAGDIILFLDGNPMGSLEVFQAALLRCEGRSVPIQIRRVDGKVETKQVLVATLSNR